MPAAQAGTMRWSGWGTGGVGPWVGRGGVVAVVGRGGGGVAGLVGGGEDAFGFGGGFAVGQRQVGGGLGEGFHWGAPYGL